MSAEILPKVFFACFLQRATVFKGIPIASNKTEVAYNQDVKCLKPKEGVNARYILFCLQFCEKRDFGTNGLLEAHF